MLSRFHFQLGYPTETHFASQMEGPLLLMESKSRSKYCNVILHCQVLYKCETSKPLSQLIWMTSNFWHSSFGTCFSLACYICVIAPSLSHIHTCSSVGEKRTSADTRISVLSRYSQKVSWNLRNTRMLAKDLIADRHTLWNMIYCQTGYSNYIYPMRRMEKTPTLLEGTLTQDAFSGKHLQKQWKMTDKHSLWIISRVKTQGMSNSSLPAYVFSTMVCMVYFSRQQLLEALNI